jgi:hypothetical protein
MQLSRIPGGKVFCSSLKQITLDLIYFARKSNPKALKLRTDLLASFDTLSSHLNTTYTALSTAFALLSGSGPRPTRRAYLAILVGPSIGSAKTKVMFAVDGLATKVWGERDDVEEESEDSDDESAGGDVSAENDDEPHSEPSDTDSSTESDDEASSPPPSRSPSPSPCTSPLPTLRAESLPPASSLQQTLRTATRLLAHTLATADHSMSAELGTILPFFGAFSSADSRRSSTLPNTHPRPSTAAVYAPCVDPAADSVRGARRSAVRIPRRGGGYVRTDTGSPQGADQAGQS